MLTANRKTPHGLIHFFYWALWTCSLIAGVYIVIKAGTRGAFLATPIIVYAFIQYITSSKKLKFLISILFISLLTITYLSNSYLQYRTQDGILEIKHWLDKTQTETSAGFRLSMFEISIEIFKEKPLAGYGEFGYEEALRKIEKKGRYSSESIQIMIDAGPHSTLFETAVNYGLIGLFGYFFLMLTPTAIFLRDKSIKKWRGLCFMFSLILMGQSINIITLKYTSSIFGFFLSILLADALNKKQTVAIAGNA